MASNVYNVVKWIFYFITTSFSLRLPAYSPNGKHCDTVYHYNNIIYGVFSRNDIFRPKKFLLSETNSDGFAWRG